MCRIPVCLVGATGLGKTSMARAFSEIVRRECAVLYSFHLETQLSDLYGVFNFDSGKAKRELGYATRSYRETIRDEIQWLKKAGKIA